ncbi:DUF4845 domain-containing protein [Luteimonas mephitis]|uniref:DUF4845 domain-containing protein n=1 Tax=Luteimonas mephitis TaxID=83615 RepID=UPI0003F66122|nr:DUF4845 domain-containing protein [Luteimonas mephitis]
MKRTQRGMTLLGFIIVLGLVGFFAYIGMKLFPMYSEYYSVKQAIRGLQAEPGIANTDPGRIKNLFFRRLNISYSDNVKPENVKLERSQNGVGWDMTVDYEVRKGLVGNLDVVGKFHADGKLANVGDGG